MQLPKKKMASEDLRMRMLKDRVFRKKTVTASHYWFFHFYFWHYVRFRTAPFHKQMFSLTERVENRTIVITAFRGSAKSTIMNLSYVLWSILGVQQKKFIILVGQTQAQARQHLKNIKEELENNKILRADLGPFREEEDEWRNSCLVISNYKAKIMAVSIDQSVRGLRHGPYRPDLIICDDIEDLQSAKTKDGRDKTYQWVKGELIPAGDTGTRIVFIGNLLHEDCLLKRLQKEIEAKTLNGIYQEYPLVDEGSACLWPGKYPTSQDIETEKQRVGDEASWQREYLLRIVSTSERIIHPEWIRHYDYFPGHGQMLSAIGIDLAVSQNDSADYTAMVVAGLYRIDGKYYVYIHPNPINARLTPWETGEYAKNLSRALGTYRQPFVYVEDVAYQRMMVDTLKREGLLARGVPVHGADKRSRLALVSYFVQAGRVLFPREGCEELIEQLTGFGGENHDDLADAFSILMRKVLGRARGERMLANAAEDYSHVGGFF